jgi:hypothetical protein
MKDSFRACFMLTLDLNRKATVFYHFPLSEFAKLHTNILKHVGKNKNALTLGNYERRSAESCTYSEN